MEGITERVLTISLIEFDNYQELSISDSGTGFSKELRDKIGTPFLTSKEVGKGLGLGMYISKSILKAHEASMTIENNKSQGATIKIVFYNQLAKKTEIRPEEISCH